MELYLLLSASIFRYKATGTSYYNVKTGFGSTVTREGILKIPSHLPTKLVIPLLLISVIGTAAALTILFTHQFPPIATTTTPFITTLCAEISGVPELVATPSSVAALSSTPVFILFQCPTPTGSPAFTTSSTVGPFPVTPFFSPPSAYASVAIISHTTGTTCSPTSTGYQVITSGTAIPSLTKGASFDYCGQIVNAPTGGISSFPLEWDQ